jgi:hypothetical protein
MVGQRALAVFSTTWPRVRPQLAAMLPIGVPLALLAATALRTVLTRTGGTPAVPLDDAYIHFQFARSFAGGHPLVYSPNTPPVAGATSLLFPILLAVPYALGFREHSIVWAAWALGWVALGLLANEARHLGRALGGPLMGAGAAALMLMFAPNVWFASSGMELLPLSWLMLRGVRRAAEWCEGGFEGRERAGLRELVSLSVLAPLMRPEGAYASLLIAGTLLAVPRRRSRAFGLLALTGISSPFLLNFAFTGSFVSTTARAKWLLFSPYHTTADLWAAFVYYVKLLFGTLMNGELWTALFFPLGSAPFAIAALFALLWMAFRRGHRARATLLLLLALGSLIPATYECYLCNRVRYLWPFAPAWLLGGVALAELVGSLLARFRAEAQHSRLLVLGGFVGALASKLPESMSDLATSARAIFDQQVSLGLWARTGLPAGSRLGVNDTGAIAYFSGKQTFDVVGLTTAGESKYWVAGAGSRFEHYERLGKARLPTHFVVYREWFAIDDLLGLGLAEREVDATILGGRVMAAYDADYTHLGSADGMLGESARMSNDMRRELGMPELVEQPKGRVIDRLDVADLESEAIHGYELGEARKDDNIVERVGFQAVDGGRRNRDRERFFLDVRPRGFLVLRVSSSVVTALEVRVGTTRLDAATPFSFGDEVYLVLPPNAPSGRTEITVTSRGDGARFTSLHYLSLAPLL